VRVSEAEHKKQNIFQRALGGGGDKSYHSNSKLKVSISTNLMSSITGIFLFSSFFTRE
jgi:hypothetical protein